MPKVAKNGNGLMPLVVSTGALIGKMVRIFLVFILLVVLLILGMLFKVIVIGRGVCDITFCFVF